MKNRLAMTAALAVALGAMPASAEALVAQAPVLNEDQGRRHRAAAEAAHANRTGLNRKARRRLEAQVRKGQRP